jgi:poly-gamma-glutamate synthesis protein (capsule biosynthesis protein)
LSEATVARLSEQIARVRQPGDIQVVSLHWGPNWGYGVPEEQTRFAHALIDQAGVSVVHGHSSHHFKAVEIYRNRVVLYGCGDFVNDYEGIEGYERYRGDLSLMYVADIDPLSKEVDTLAIVPFQMRRFQLVRCSMQDSDWVSQTLERESERFSTRIVEAPEGRLRACAAGVGEDRVRRE